MADTNSVRPLLKEGYRPGVARQLPYKPKKLRRIKAADWKRAVPYGNSR